MVQNNSLEVKTNSTCSLSFPNFGTLSGGELATTRSFNPKSQLFGAGTLNPGKHASQIGLMDGLSSISRASLLCNTNNQFRVKETVGSSNLRGRIDQIRRAYWTSTKSAGKTSTASNAQAQAVENLSLCGKRNCSQFENVNSGYVNSTHELVSRQINALEGNIIQNYELNGSNTSFMNLDLSPSINVCLPNITPDASENYAPSFMLNSCNLQKEPIDLFQTRNLPISSSNINSLLASDAGLANQVEKPTNGLGGEILEAFGGIDSGEGFLMNANASSSEQPINEDIFLDEILAELRNDLADGDLISVGFNSSSVV